MESSEDNGNFYAAEVIATDYLSNHAFPASFVPQSKINIIASPFKNSGCLHLPLKFCEQTEMFLKAFQNEYNAADGILNHKFKKAYDATKEYVAIWQSDVMMKGMSSLFLSTATDHVLERNSKAASYYASLAYCFEQLVACKLSNRPTINWPKANELYFDLDEHTLISFLKKRISCGCLNAKYKQVKSVKKLGFCYNLNCPLPGRRTERSLTKCCSKCRRVNYCSHTCQKESWKIHSFYCPETSI
jgi:hypothetical protein